MYERNCIAWVCEGCGEHYEESVAPRYCGACDGQHFEGFTAQQVQDGADQDFADNVRDCQPIAYRYGIANL